MYQIKHQIKEISVYGCGGTGSHVINGLARISHALRALGKEDIHVTAWDDDQVSHDNVGRQAFYDSDVGSNKAKVLIDRVNLYLGRIGWLSQGRLRPPTRRISLYLALIPLSLGRG
jgi:PRTRC genetic system ThiF family protein